MLRQVDIGTCNKSRIINVHQYRRLNVGNKSNHSGMVVLCPTNISNQTNYTMIQRDIIKPTLIMKQYHIDTPGMGGAMLGPNLRARR